MPNTELLSLIKAMFTVNSSVLLINSLVPSRGSTSQYVSFKLFSEDNSKVSSEIMGMSGVNWFNLFKIISFAFLSAIVKGDQSFLLISPKSLLS